MTKGMAFEENVLEIVVDKLGGRVLVALYLVAHHLALFLHLILRILAMEHDVLQHIEGTAQVALFDGAVVDGVLLVREGIELAAQPLDGVDDLRGGTPLRALEGQMLAEMSQSLLLRRLVTGAGMHGDAAVSHLRCAGQVKHPHIWMFNDFGQHLHCSVSTIPNG